MEYVETDKLTTSSVNIYESMVGSVVSLSKRSTRTIVFFYFIDVNRAIKGTVGSLVSLLKHSTS